MTLIGHEGSVNSLAFSPDGQRIISGSSDKTIKIWDTTIYRDTWEPDIDAYNYYPRLELLTLIGHEARVGSVAFSYDGKRIVSSGGDNTIKVWDPAFEVLAGHENPVFSVAFSPDGKRIVSGSGDQGGTFVEGVFKYIDGTINVWDVATGEELMIMLGHNQRVGSVSFSPDGQRIVSMGKDDKTIKFWDAATGEELMTLPGYYGWVAKSVAFSPDGKRIASGIGSP
ncbi:WD40 repeat domain-containing protein [Planctomycetota bacterium]